MCQKITLEISPQFHLYPVNQCRVIDGDTAEVELDLWENLSFIQSCRIFGIDAPERGNESSEKVKLVLEKIINLAQSLSDGFIYCSYLKKDKFHGRFIGNLFVCDESANINIGEYFLNIGIAKPYQGRKKFPWAEDEEKMIIEAANDCLKLIAKAQALKDILL